MIGRTSLFSQVRCPEEETCQRPYCHFRHALRQDAKSTSAEAPAEASTSAISLSSSVLDSLLKSVTSGRSAQSASTTSVVESASTITIEQEDSTDAATQYVGYVVAGGQDGSIQQQQSDYYGGGSSYYASASPAGYGAASSGYQASGVYQQLPYGYMDPSMYAPEDPTYTYQPPTEYQPPAGRRRPLLPDPPKVPPATAAAQSPTRSSAHDPRSKRQLSPKHPIVTQVEDAVVGSSQLEELAYPDETPEQPEHHQKKRATSPTGEFSVLKKSTLPIDLADDEILNPRIRPIAPKPVGERKVATVKPTVNHANKPLTQAGVGGAVKPKVTAKAVAHPKATISPRNGASNDAKIRVDPERKERRTSEDDPRRPGGTRQAPHKQGEFQKCIKAVADIDKQIEALKREAHAGKSDPSWKKESKAPKQSAAIRPRVDVDALFGERDGDEDDEVQVIETSSGAHMTKPGPSVKTPQPAPVEGKRVAHSAAATVPRSQAPEESKKPRLENAHREHAVAASVAKGEARKAHVGKAGARRPTVLEVPGCKVAPGVRQMYITMLYDDCLKIANPDVALKRAQDEEKQAASKAHGKSGYLAAVSNVRGRLRAAAILHPTVTLDAVSHHEVLAGRHAQSITVGANRSVTKHGQLGEAEFYDILKEKYLLSYEQMRENSYPLWDPFDEGVVTVNTSQRDRNKQPYVEDNDPKRVCCRCGTEYLIKPNGEFVRPSECLYHYGKAFKRGGKGQMETRYTCCDSDLSVKGCVYGDCHVTNSQPKSVFKQFVGSPRPCGPGDTRSRRVYAVDCEMVYTPWGPEVARITVVDILGQAVMDELIRPDHPVLDYNSRFSGLTKESVDNASLDLKQAQERLFELVNSDSILIGHSLESDLKAMRIVHKSCVDTSVVFPHKMGPPHKKALKTLASDILKKIIQENESGHDSKEDAVACMQIMLRRARDATI